MKNFLTFYLPFILALFFLTSCEDKEQSTSPIDNNNPYITFKYQGKTYDSNESRQLYNSLQENPNLAAYVFSDGIIEYFDSYEVLEQNLSRIDKEELSQTRSSTTYYKTSRIDLHIYDRTYFDKSGDYDCIRTTTGQYHHDISALYTGGPVRNWSNKISSFEISGECQPVSSKDDAYPRPYIMFYDGIYYTGKIITFSPYIDRPIYEAVPDLSRYGWDNKINSIQLRFVPYDI